MTQRLHLIPQRRTFLTNTTILGWLFQQLGGKDQTAQIPLEFYIATLSYFDLPAAYSILCAWASALGITNTFKSLLLRITTLHFYG